MDLLLHPAEDAARHRPGRPRRLSTVGHADALRAFARAAQAARVRFMLIGGTYRDVLVRAMSTRDIDVVLVDRDQVPEEAMQEAGFSRNPRLRHAWRYRAGDRVVDLEIAATASTSEGSGPFSVAFRYSRRVSVEGCRVAVPRVEDYLILKLLAAASDHRRRARDLLDVRFALDAYPKESRGALSVPALRARMRDLYGIRGEQLKELTALLRQVPRS